MSQPPLSQQIKQIEKQLGFELFERSTRSVKVSTAGKLFVAQAHKVLLSHQQLGEFLLSQKQGVVEPFRLGSIGLAFESFLAPVIASFVKQQPTIQLKLQEASTQELINQCQSGLLDAAIVRLYNSELPDEQLTKIYEEPYVAAIPADWVIKDQTISLTQLAQLPYIGYPRHIQPALFDVIEGAFLKAGKRAAMVQQMRTKGSTIALVEAGIGFAIVPSSLIPKSHNEMTNSKVRFIAIDESLPPVEIYLYSPAKNKHPILATFVERLINHSKD